MTKQITRGLGERVKVRLDISWLRPSVLAIVVFPALYRALKHLDKSYAAIVALLGIASEVLTLAYPTTGEGAPALVYHFGLGLAISGLATYLWMAEFRSHHFHRQAYVRRKKGHVRGTPSPGLSDHSDSHQSPSMSG